jgi:Domain of unknown function (DUF4328)
MGDQLRPAGAETAQPTPCSHAASSISATCARCGSYACDECLVEGPTDPLCTACDVRIARGARDGVLATMRVLRPALAVAAVTCGLSALCSRALSVTSADTEGFAALLLVLVFTVCTITWCVWFRRANRALSARGVELGFGPNAWFWFFVPVASLVVPYRAVRELWTRAAGSTKAPKLFRVWWGFWIAAHLFMPLTWDIEAADNRDVLRQFELMSLLFQGAAALAARQVVQSIGTLVVGPLPTRAACSLRDDPTTEPAEAPR